MQTSDSSNFFQSDAQHARFVASPSSSNPRNRVRRIKNNHKYSASFRRAKHLLHAETGDPIKLNSRPLRVVIRQKEGKEADAFCAESGFVIRRVGLEVSSCSCSCFVDRMIDAMWDKLLVRLDAEDKL
jgi:hypothetical protein